MAAVSMKLLRFFGGIAGWATVSLWAANPGDEVVVVYNCRVAESKSIAQYYAQKRQVPTNQIFGFDLPTTEEMSRDEYERGLQLPLAEAIKTNKLWHFETQFAPATNHEPAKVTWRLDESKIRYALLCYGVPVRISADPTHQE